MGGELTNVVVTTVARAEPSPVIASLTNGYATQVCANTKHNEPFWLLGPGGVRFWVAKGFDVDLIRFIDLVWGSVSDKHWLSAPFDDDVLA